MENTCKKHLWSDETFDEETGNDVCELCGAVRETEKQSPLKQMADHANAIADLLAHYRYELEPEFKTAILRQIKSIKAILRKEAIK